MIAYRGQLWKGIQNEVFVETIEDIVMLSNFLLLNNITSIHKNDEFNTFLHLINEVGVRNVVDLISGALYSKWCFKNVLLHWLLKLINFSYNIHHACYQTFYSHNLRKGKI